MKFESITAALLIAALSATLILPASASSFSDVSDPDTAVNADILRMMGVVDGVGDNQFNPLGTLTRGAFCKMLVSYMGLEDQLPLYETRTIFSDVPASHWAAPYINLAASTASGEEGMLIAGVGDGTFRPDTSITVAEATTILVRVLGYSDGNAGAIWPMGYLNLASSIGLTSDMSLEPYSYITRSEAAQLFVQALSSNTASGSLYYESLGGNYVEDVMVLATNVDSDSGQPGAIRTSEGTYLPQQGGMNPSSLQGRRGVLVISDKLELVTFLPDHSQSLSVTLSESAQATYLVSSGGTYSIHSSTPVFTYGNSTGQESYAEAWIDLQSGSNLTLFLENGTVTAIYAGQSQLAEEAIVVSGTPSRSSFYAITGGSTDFKIVRNGQEISLSTVGTDDVATYDATPNTLLISDLRLTAVYESGSPNSTTPTSIHSLGHDFPVLDGALDVSDNIKVGQTVTFLLTADGSIAAIKNTSTSRRSTAYGIAGENAVDVTLPAGGTITLTGSETISENLQNRLVTVSSSASGRLTASRITSNGAGALDVGAMKLGDYTIAAGFALYEEVSGGAISPLSIAALDMDTIAASDIATYRLDASGNVDIIVLDGVTGDSYTYGKLIESKKESSGNYLFASNRTVSVENSGTGSSPAITDLICTTSITGDFGGVTLGQNGRAGSLVVLDGIEGISRSDFFTTDGKTYVTVKGKSYPVSQQVECYNEDSKSWISLSAIRAYSDDLTVYIDPLGDTVRIVTAKEN